jgi:hypothetical protein
MKPIHYLLFLCLLAVLGCSQTLPAFKAEDQPSMPDYSNEANWSGLPFRGDATDEIPNYETWVSDSQKTVDVFYIYPTIYKFGDTWNADLNNNKLNRRIDKLPVKFQATVFNEMGRVYAPRYRQGCIESFSDSANGPKALAFAYEDVKMAFEYYMEHYNQGRPIIIASHSQGTYHARRLLKEYFDTPAKKQQLVCAYIVGYAIYPDQYEVLTPCKNASETGCYVTWSSFDENFYYPDTANDFLVGKVIVNPITWNIDTAEVQGKGAFLFNLNRKKLFATSAYMRNNMLWVDTKVPLFKQTNVLHLLDYNLFWHDIRANVKLRVNAYQTNSAKSTN